tara:strand:+ start:96 stop:332 length:237 start_codon:yes stop_codon:yes gene_type:complete
MKIRIIPDNGQEVELTESETGTFVQNLKEVNMALYQIQKRSANLEITPEQSTDINQISKNAKNIMIKKIATALGINLE